ncbi:MAG: 2-C-methyl-D-erythritol 4-phosphate cytidylyltransferase [Phycisphaerales bacterium]|jgi:2-C-methyl-D-erythritol 4-phosphate cytidylyltransferase|nr:2-C-methyl-D-erythritol 4-phosphate cytidylyltransferase [Phycisphaerales bacterium]
MKFSVIIPAGGSSSRFGSKDKLAEDFGGRPLLLRTVEFFTKREDVVEIIVAGPMDKLDEFKERFGPALSFHGVKIIAGGRTRSESVSNALKFISDDSDRVAIHDAARPCLTNDLLDKLLLASGDLDAVAAALPIVGTLKRTLKEIRTVGDEDAIADSILGTSTKATVSCHLVEKTIDRNELWELQTPQIFDVLLLKKGYEQGDLSNCTDDAQVIEKLGHSVYLIEGDSRNIKVTTQADLKLVKAFLGIRGEKPRPTHKRF